MFNNKTKKMTDPCELTRATLAEQVGGSSGPIGAWLMNHLHSCDRCRDRLAGYNRVSLGLMMMKTQPHRPDLLALANSRTLNYLKNAVRETPQAVELSHTVPCPGFWQRMVRRGQGLVHAAACLVAILLMKTSVFTSFSRTQQDGASAMKYYYASNLGENNSELEDIFKA